MQFKKSKNNDHPRNLGDTAVIEILIDMSGLSKTYIVA